MTGSDERIPTGVWVDAHLRRLSQEGTGYYIIQKGAWASGTVLLKINTLGPEGCLLYQQQRDLDGRLGWMLLERLPEAEADARIRRAAGHDPDLWAIEIEDRAGHNPFE